MSKEKRLVILLSGQGSNAAAIIQSCQQGLIQAKVVAIYSDRADAKGLTLAAAAGIAHQAVCPADFTDKITFEAHLAQLINQQQADIVILAGFMRRLGPIFVQQFQGRLLNIHPSLLPKYPGLETHQRVLANQDSEHGCSVHFVDESLDGGALIAQTRCAVKPDDDIDSLKKRVQELEYSLYSQVIHWLAQGRLQLLNHQVYLDDKAIKFPAK